MTMRMTNIRHAQNSIACYLKGSGHLAVAMPEGKVFFGNLQYTTVAGSARTVFSLPQEQTRSFALQSRM